MLTRESQLSPDKALEVGYVAEKVKVTRQDASSVLPSVSVDGRQSGSGTKRVHTNGLSLTVPRGDTDPVKIGALSAQADARGNSRIFVLGKNKKPLMPCTQSRAQELLCKGRAVVHKLIPFTIRLKLRTSETTQPIAIKIDPGSKKTGIALVREEEVPAVSHPLHLAELEHHSATISSRLQRRSRYRRGRRTRNLRYRAPRFHNRTKPKGWLAPSLRHLVEGTVSLVDRYRKLCPILRVAIELVRFDTQQMEKVDIQGTEYQQGTLYGFEVKEYLLEKWERRCAYCAVASVPLQVEHIQPKSRGGSNRISNLCLACGPCNQKKSARSIDDFLKAKPALLAKIKAQAKTPLKNAAAVNSTRKALVRALEATKLPVETASGGRTKYNRSRLNIPKTHALDALCVGNIDQAMRWNLPTLELKGVGRGRYARTSTDSSGFPRGRMAPKKNVHGFQTGDRVRATVDNGKKKGSYTGRVAVRATGYFDIKMKDTLVQGILYKKCVLLARGDGYQYEVRAPLMLFSGASAPSILNAGITPFERPNGPI